VKQKILMVEPHAAIEVTGRSSRGDRELHVPLSSLDGTDFFTTEIFEALANDEADIAVHSLKDMSAPHFFSHNAFAIVDRDDMRDVAIFNPDITEKIKAGKTIVVGTCSPRREEMAIGFLKKALPQLHHEIRIETKSIRGNVEGRLTQLHEGNYDATILATAGLNRLLRSEEALLQTPPVANSPVGGLIQNLISNKKRMLLPLIECVPAPCQGAIVAEAHPSNSVAVEIIKKINDEALFTEAFAEKKKAFEYGTGCLQKFGVTTIQTKNAVHLFAAGEDYRGNQFQHWTNLPQLSIDENDLFSSTDYMKDFFDYQWKNKPISIPQPAVFIANYKAVKQSTIENILMKGASPISPSGSTTAGNPKIILASGTKTWFELAKRGYWVTASADALGFENLLPVLEMPLFRIQANSICILTHETAAQRWKQKDYAAVANYQLVAKHADFIATRIAESKAIFWSSFSQYEQYGKYASFDATHICAGGETASLLQHAGVNPVIFPTIKAFEQWRKSFTHSRSVA
jgi:hydroxymethylbilane synthase